MVRIDMLDERRVDVKALRDSLGTTRERFAARYRMGPDGLRNWEQQVAEPNAVARDFLAMIAHDPKRTEELLWNGL